MLAWYVIQTQVKKEQEVKYGLIKKGYEVFLPMYRKTNKTGESILPLFSGYLFAQFDRGVDGWQEISRTMGVSRILGYSAEKNTISPCKDDAIPGLQAFCDAQGIIDMGSAFPAPDHSYSQGEAVRITGGLFEGKVATYWNPTKNGAMVILSLLNRPVRVILRDDEITRE